MTKRVFDRIVSFTVYAFVIYLFLQEYRDHGIKGLVIVLIGGLALFIIIDFGIEFLARKHRENH